MSLPAATEPVAGDEPTPASRRHPPLGANYRKVFTASVISNLGDGVAQIGYPWLASAVTRNPLLIAGVAVAQRLPWLLFTLPAGVITDRVDRRRLMVVMDSVRALLTAAVAIAVLGLGDSLPSPDHLGDVVGTRSGLYLVIVVATLLLGCAEVLRDNSAQTIIPAIVHPDHLERANGRMWSAEQVANTFVGPPLGSFLLGAAFFLPFVVDAASFAVAAGLVFLLVGQFRAGSPRPGARTADEAAAATAATPATAAPARQPAAPGAWRGELKEGLRWLWHHPLLRPMAIILGLMNAIGTLQLGTLILFAQEVLHTTSTEFAILSMGAAVGGVLGSYTASAISRRLGSGPSLALTLLSTALAPIPIAFASWWPLVFSVFAVSTFFGSLWNVITVSLRQAIIPGHLLGRVNSVYRFFAWGMMPIGTAVGGLTVFLVDRQWSRETALRAPWLLSSVAAFVLSAYAIPKLTTDKLDAARREGIAANELADNQLTGEADES